MIVYSVHFFSLSFLPRSCANSQNHNPFIFSRFRTLLKTVFPATPSDSVPSTLFAQNTGVGGTSFKQKVSSPQSRHSTSSVLRISGFWIPVPSPGRAVLFGSRAEILLPLHGTRDTDHGTRFTCSAVLPLQRLQLQFPQYLPHSFPSQRGARSRSLSLPLYFVTSLLRSPNANAPLPIHCSRLARRGSVPPPVPFSGLDFQLSTVQPLPAPLPPCTAVLRFSDHLCKKDEP